MALWTRLVLGVMAVMLATLGVLLMLDPTRRELSEHSPFALIGLTGAYLGAWCAFAALLAGWSAWCNDWRQARVPVLTLAALPIGALIAMARVPDAASFAYTAALLAVTILGVACLATDRRRATTTA